MRRVYISGPMSNMPEHNFPAFNAEAARLRDLGYDVVNPVDVNPDPGTPWHECLRRDLRQLREAVQPSESPLITGSDALREYRALTTTRT